ncbi:MAG TPA: hypothetical protein VKZ78_03740 [Sphingobacteriaceae bacterium]|nr:hypothetical protein [Sphingobacteriaceae bacterium]
MSVIVGLMVIAGCEKQEEVKLGPEMIYEVNGMKLGCPVESINGPEKSVIGKWKLVKTTTYYQSSGTINTDLEHIDLSCINIIHHFQSNGTLEISNDAIDYGDPVHFFYSPFEFKLTRLNNQMAERYTLKMGEFSYGCDIRNHGRILIQKHPDSPSTQYFVRIK